MKELKNIEILNKPALVSFDQFFSKEKKPSNTLSRVRGVIVHLATRDGFKDVLTLHHIVTYGTQPSCKKIDQEWMRLPECGKKALELIDRWLASFNLHRGMKL